MTTEQEPIVPSGNVVAAKIAAHKQTCRGTFKVTRFLGGVNYYSDTYVCPVCSDCVTEQGNRKANSTRTRLYYDAKEMRWYE